MRESDIERYLVKRVKELGGLCRKVKFIGVNGAPDRVVMLPARPRTVPVSSEVWFPRIGLACTFWVEVKATGKESEPHQLREHKRMRRVGQQVFVVDSFEQIDEVLA